MVLYMLAMFFVSYVSISVGIARDLDATVADIELQLNLLVEEVHIKKNNTKDLETKVHDLASDVANQKNKTRDMDGRVTRFEGM